MLVVFIQVTRKAIKSVLYKMSIFLQELLCYPLLYHEVLYTITEDYSDWSNNNSVRNIIVARLFEKNNEGLYKGKANRWKQITTTMDLVVKALNEKS